jgi:rubrerythrin
MADFDFTGDTFDLDSPEDREILRFVLSQALFGEATGVYCGKSLYAARSLEAARFYLRQARQELNHLELFAEIFRTLELEPVPAHWVIKLLSAHNNYYPLKVFMEHAVGEGMVLDIFRDVLMQALPDGDPRVEDIKKKLAVVCREEEEHIAWGEKETRRLLAASPWLRHPFYGLLELQLLLAPLATRAFAGRAAQHRVLRHLPRFVDHVRARVWAQGQALGFVPAVRPGLPYRLAAMTWGVALFVRSQFARSTSTLEKTYLTELGFSK